MSTLKAIVLIKNRRELKKDRLVWIMKIMPRELSRCLTLKLKPKPDKKEVVRISVKGFIFLMQ